MEAGFYGRLVADHHHNSPGEMKAHQNKGDYAGYSHQLRQDWASLKAAWTIAPGDSGHQQRAAGVGCEAKRKGSNLPPFQLPLDPLASHPNGVEDQGQGDEND